MTKKLHFNFPKCGKGTLEEVMGDVTVSRQVFEIEIDDNGDFSDFDYGESELEDGEVLHYICGRWVTFCERLMEVKSFLKKI